TQNVSDFIVKSTEGGFTEVQIAAAEEEFGAENINAGMSLDVELTFGEEKGTARLYFLDFENWTVNVPRYVSGKT
ncbi:hypothetical protein DK853_48115, partial [Klebsiella oxytoca]